MEQFDGKPAAALQLKAIYGQAISLFRSPLKCSVEGIFRGMAYLTSNTKVGVIRCHPVEGSVSLGAHLCRDSSVL
jgi:hypothetical protein